MKRACEVCDGVGPVIEWRGQVLCPPCCEVAVQWSPMFVLQSAREAAQRGDDATHDTLATMGGWLETFHGEPVPPERGA